MAKDDYDYIVFKILTYLYTCLKRQNSFDENVFRSAIVTKDISDDYLTDILRMMEAEDLIEDVLFTKAWGTTYILISDFECMRITSTGIRYVLNNDKMKGIKEKILKSTPGMILELVKMAF